MKEFVFAYFIFTPEEYEDELAKLVALGDDFKLLYCGDYQIDMCMVNLLPIPEYKTVSGQINTQTASFIKLQNPALAEKMRISYTSEELKNRYRR